MMLLFDDDQLLERLWRSPTQLRRLALAGYDLVVAPSCSLWSDRPRAEHLLMLKRSLRSFSILQRCGARAVPRMAWEIAADVGHAADWLNANSCVDVVGLDLQTYGAPGPWQSQLAGLKQLDRATGRRLRFIINGPSREQRFADLYATVDPERITVTNTALATPPERLSDQLGLADDHRTDVSLHLAARTRRFQQQLQTAAEAAGRRG